MADEVAPRRGTATSAFGVSKRENHDASGFYERFTAPDLSTDSAVGGRRDIDEIVCGDARFMEKVDDASVALVVTSPPYFAGKEYETALGEGHVPATYAEYLGMLEDVFAECVRTLEPGGRIAVNVANLGRKPYRSLSGDVTWILQDRLRLLLRGEVIWVKARGAGGSCAWGSFQKPGNPVLRDLTERVIIASKGRFDRAVPQAERARRQLPSTPTVSRDEFMEATTDIWEIPPESAAHVGHPAPFPVELPERLIHLHTYRDDLVLDPFSGSGTTAVAAVRTGRHFVGYDTEPAYVEAARRRVDDARRGAAARAEPILDSARDILTARLDAAGYTARRDNVAIGGGFTVTCAAVDPAGRPVFIDVAGGLTAVRPGLRRGDVLWKAMAKAAFARATHPDTAFVLAAPALPPARTGPAAALAAVTGAGLPVTAVVDLGQPATGQLF